MPRKTNVERDQEILRRLEEGQSWSMIQKEMGVSPSMIARAKKRTQIERTEPVIWHVDDDHEMVSDSVSSEDVEGLKSKVKDLEGQLRVSQDLENFYRASNIALERKAKQLEEEISERTNWVQNHIDNGMEWQAKYDSLLAMIKNIFMEMHRAGKRNGTYYCLKRILLSQDLNLDDLLFGQLL